MPLRPLHDVATRATERLDTTMMALLRLRGRRDYHAIYHALGTLRDECSTLRAQMLAVEPFVGVRGVPPVHEEEGGS